MRTVVWASLRLHARRYLACGLAVVLGVGFVVAALSLGGAARAGIGAALGQQYQAADVVVESDQVASTRVAQRLGEALSQRDDVAGQAIAWQTYQVDAQDRVIGIGSVADDPRLRWQRLVTGDFPAEAGEAVVSQAYADGRGVSVGDVVDLGEAGADVEVTGVVDDAYEGLSAYLREADLAATRDAAWMDTTVLAAAGTSPTDLATALAADLPVTAQTAEEYVRDLTTRLTGDIDVVQRLLLGFAAIAMFVAAMVVANTFTIVLAQRSRDLALLRCVGAGRAQLVRAVLAESALVGAVAAALGVGLGLAGVAIGVAVVGDAVEEVPLALPTPTWGVLLWPWLAGVVVTWAGALVPALRGTRIPPVAALRRDESPEPPSGPSRLRTLMAVGVLALGFACLLLGARRGDLLIGLAGGAVSFVGVLLATPVVVPVVLAALGCRPLRRTGIPARMAIDGLARSPRRTAATSGALMVGVTLIALLVVGMASTEATTRAVTDQQLPLDVAVVAGDTERPGGSLSSSTVESLSRVDSVEQVALLDGALVTVGGRELAVLGVDADAGAVLRGDLLAPGDDTLIAPYGLDGSRGGFRALGGGDRLDIVLGEGFGPAALVSPATLDRVLAAGAARPLESGAAWLRVADDADPAEVAADLDEIAQSGDAVIDGGLQQRAQLGSLLDVMLLIAAALLGVAVLIAVVGVGNTLALSVLERARENAVLRALGLGAAQLRRMIALEALLMAVVAAALGIALGTAYAWFGVRTLLGPEYGSGVVLEVPWARLAVLVALTALAGLLASWLPARRAGRTPPVAALAG